MEKTPWIELVVIRGEFLRVLGQGTGNGVNFDEPELDYVLDDDDPKPEIYLIIEKIDTQAEELVLLLKGFEKEKLVLKPYTATKIKTVAGEQIIVGFNNIKSNNPITS